MHEPTLNKLPSLLFIAAWWPRDDDSFGGLFIREHALSLRPWFNVHVVQLEIRKTNKGPLFRIIEHVRDEDGLTLHLLDVHTRLRRFGMHDFLVKRAYEKCIRNLKRREKLKSYCLNVRSHLTRFVPELPSTREMNFIHIEHFSYYHRILGQLPPEQKKREIAEIQRWFNNDHLKRILTVSRDLANVLVKQFGVTEDKIALIHNVAHAGFYFRPDAKHDGDELRVVSIAAWNGPKRPKLLLEAALMLPEYWRDKLEFHFYGDGQLMPEAKEFSREHSAKIKVVFHGFQAKSVLAEALAGAAFMAHPTDAENAPTVISEALCCGTPVLSMDVNGIPEMVQSHNGVLVKPGDSEALKNGMLSILTRLDSIDRRGIADEAHEKYSPENVGRRLAEYIHECLVSS